jgi:signal recognition particle GTPase
MKSMQTIKHLIIGGFVFFMVACNTIKNQTPEQVQQNLTTAMQNFLQKTQQRDSNKVIFTVKSVAYYEEAQYYICDFKVHMQNNPQIMANIPKIDTVGTMHCRITKDFQNVTRVY